MYTKDRNFVGINEKVTN